MKDLITFIVKALVDHPEQVLIRDNGRNNPKILSLEVAKGHMGKVIGRQGRTDQALRTIPNAASAKHNIKTVLEIVD